MTEQKIEKRAPEVYPEDFGEESKEYQVTATTDSNKELRNAYIKGMTDMWDEVEDDIEFLNCLKVLHKAEKRIKLDELIDMWWMQEDKDGNRMISFKEHFTSAMKKAYSVGLAQRD